MDRDVRSANQGLEELLVLVEAHVSEDDEK